MKQKLLVFALFLAAFAASAQNHSMDFARTTLGGTNIELSNGPILGQNFTLEAFFKPDSNKSQGFIFGQDSLNAGATAYRRAPYISINNFKTITYGFDTLNGTTPVHLSKKIFASHDKLWNHAAMTYNGSVLKLYVNGKLLDSLVVKANVAPISIKYIGGQMRGISNVYFNGKIEEVRAWNVCRTATEIFANDNVNVLTGTETNLVMLYEFENNSLDSTGLSTVATATATADPEAYTQTTYPALRWTNLRTPGVLSMSVKTSRTVDNLNTSPGKYDSCSVFAAYITDANDKPIKTLVHYGANHAYELFFYEKDFGGLAPDVISGASRYSKPADNFTMTYNLEWDGKDMYGNLVEDGTYKLKFDLNDHTLKTTGTVMTGIGCNWDTIFVKGATAFSWTPGNDTSITNMSMAWLPTATHSLNFTRSDSTKVTITNGPILGQNFTAEAFFTSASNVSQAFVFGQDSLNAGATAYRRAPFISIVNNKAIIFGFDAANAHLSKTVCAAHNNLWNHAALTYNGSVLSLYMNGKLVDTLNRVVTVDPIRIKYIGGQYRGTSSIHFSGKVDEVRVWDVCKTPSEIGTNANVNVLVGNEANLQMLYEFEGNVTDKTGKSTASLYKATLDTNTYEATTYPALTWAGNGTAGTLTVDVTTNPTVLPTGAGQQFAFKSIFAVWVTDQNNKVVKTLRSYGARHNYELFVYNNSLGNYAPDVVTGATQVSTNLVDSSITYNITWDGKDMFGNLVDDGTYTLNFDLNDHKPGTGGLPAGSEAGNSISYNWVKGTSADVQTPSDYKGLTSLGIAWNPDGTVGIQNVTTQKDVNIYPNPSNGSFNIEIGEAITGNVTIKIYNAMGQMISNSQINKNEASSLVKVNSNNLESGIYTVEVIGNGKSTQSKMIITK